MLGNRFTATLTRAFHSSITGFRAFAILKIPQTTNSPLARFFYIITRATFNSILLCIAATIIIATIIII